MVVKNLKIVLIGKKKFGVKNNMDDIELFLKIQLENKKAKITEISLDEDFVFNLITPDPTGKVRINESLMIAGTNWTISIDKITDEFYDLCLKEIRRKEK